MGILNGPRINFWGGIQTNVCTTNNSENIRGASSDGPNLVDLATATVSPANTMTDQELIAYIREPWYQSDGTQYYMNGSWNYYGDHQVHYVDAAVSSEGEAGAVSETGDLVGQPVYLLGSVDPVTGQGPFFGPVMVDLDPTSSATTQIYVGGLQIGSNADIKLLIRHDTVGSSQALGIRVLQGEPDAPGSSKATAIFQMTFPLSSIRQYDKSCATLNAIVTDPRATGIVLRFSMFEMAPYMTTPELQAAFEANRNPSNPSSGRVVGTIGPAYAGEPDACPPGRILYNSVGGATGYAMMNAGKSLLSIDTSAMLQKAKFRADRKDFTGPIGPNIDYGPITVSAGSPPAPTGVTFDARPADYYKYGGIVDVAVDPRQLETLSKEALTLSGSKGDNTVTCTEQALRIYSNARNIYINETADHTATVPLIVSHLGGPVPADTTITLTSGPSGTLPDPGFLKMRAQPGLIGLPATVTVPSGSMRLDVELASTSNQKAGFEQITFTWKNPRASGHGSTATDSSYFVNFRNYLETDFGIPAGSRITWEQAFEHTLRYFFVIFPAMSMRIPLNDEGTIQATGPQIKARISPRFRGTTLAMPITRSMSPSQEALLTAFLDGTLWSPPGGTPPVA